MITRSANEMLGNKLVENKFELMNSEFHGTKFAINRYRKLLPGMVMVFVSIYPHIVECNVLSQYRTLSKSTFTVTQDGATFVELVMSHVKAIEKLHTVSEMSSEL